MFDLTYWFIFFSAAIAINISPGPDFVYILSQTLSQGKKMGIASCLGVCSGAFFHVVATALGVSALLKTSTIAFTLVKYLGAAYMIYLGIKAFRSEGKNLDLQNIKYSQASFWLAFKQGVLIDILNPKMAIFFIAFLPQFVRPQYGSTSLQLFLLGTLIIAIAICVELLLVFIASKATYLLQGNKSFTIWLDRLLGMILTGLGLRLLFSTI